MSDCTTKTCSRCRRILPKTAEFFYHDKTAKGNLRLRNPCKQCRSEIAKQKNNHPVNNGIKVCIDCGCEKPATTDYFYARKIRKDGLESACKDCLANQRGTKRHISPYLNAPQGTKRCGKCGQYVELSGFCNNKTRSDGLNNWCRECNHKNHKRWYGENSDHAIQYSKEWRDAHKNEQAYKAWWIEWRRKHKEYIRHYSVTTTGRRIKLLTSLPNDFTLEDWARCLEYWGDKCAVCGKTRDFWTIIAKDHWIPLVDKRPNNPGTVPANIIPLCHSKRDGEGGCNNIKYHTDPVKWLVSKLGKRKAMKKLKEIQAYFEWVAQQRESE